MFCNVLFLNIPIVCIVYFTSFMDYKAPLKKNKLSREGGKEKMTS